VVKQPLNNFFFLIKPQRYISLLFFLAYVYKLCNFHGSFNRQPLAARATRAIISSVYSRA